MGGVDVLHYGKPIKGIPPEANLLPGNKPAIARPMGGVEVLHNGKPVTGVPAELNFLPGNDPVVARPLGNAPVLHNGKPVSGVPPELNYIPGNDPIIARPIGGVDPKLTFNGKPVGQSFGNYPIRPGNQPGMIHPNGPGPQQVYWQGKPVGQSFGGHPMGPGSQPGMVHPNGPGPVEVYWKGHRVGPTLPNNPMRPGDSPGALRPGDSRPVDASWYNNAPGKPSPDGKPQKPPASDSSLTKPKSGKDVHAPSDPGLSPAEAGPSSQQGVSATQGDAVQPRPKFPETEVQQPAHHGPTSEQVESSQVKGAGKPKVVEQPATEPHPPAAEANTPKIMDKPPKAGGKAPHNVVENSPNHAPKSPPPMENSDATPGNSPTAPEEITNPRIKPGPGGSKNPPIAERPSSPDVVHVEPMDPKWRNRHPRVHYPETTVDFSDSDANVPPRADSPMESVENIPEIPPRPKPRPPTAGSGPNTNSEHASSPGSAADANVPLEPVKQSPKVPPRPKPKTPPSRPDIKDPFDIGPQTPDDPVTPGKFLNKGKGRADPKPPSEIDSELPDQPVELGKWLNKGKGRADSKPTSEIDSNLPDVKPGKSLNKGKGRADPKPPSELGSELSEHPVMPKRPVIKGKGPAGPKMPSKIPAERPLPPGRPPPSPPDAGIPRPAPASPDPLAPPGTPNGAAADFWHPQTGVRRLREHSIHVNDRVTDAPPVESTTKAKGAFRRFWESIVRKLKAAKTWTSDKLRNMFSKAPKVQAAGMRTEAEALAKAGSKNSEIFREIAKADDLTTMIEKMEMADAAEMRMEDELIRLGRNIGPRPKSVDFARSIENLRQEMFKQQLDGKLTALGKQMAEKIASQVNASPDLAPNEAVPKPVEIVGKPPAVRPPPTRPPPTRPPPTRPAPDPVPWDPMEGSSKSVNKFIELSDKDFDTLMKLGVEQYEALIKQSKFEMFLKGFLNSILPLLASCQ